MRSQCDTTKHRPSGSRPGCCFAGGFTLMGTSEKALLRSSTIASLLLGLLLLPVWVAPFGCDPSSSGLLGGDVNDGSDVESGGDDNVATDDDPSDDEVLGEGPPPVVEVSALPSVFEGDAVTLDGSNSRSSDGSNLHFSWAQTAGPGVALVGASESIASFTAPQVDADDRVSFLLTVTGKGGKSTATVDVDVLNVPDLASAGPELVIAASVEAGEVPLSVTFTAGSADGSALPEGQYTWDFGDGSQAEGLEATYVFNSANAYTVTVCYSPPGDPDNILSCGEVVVTATQAPEAGGGGGGGGGDPPPPNQLPVCDAGADQVVTDSDDNGSESLTLDGSGSIDNDGTIANYLWEEGSTTLCDGASATCTVSLAVGTHSVTMTATDDNGESCTDTTVVVVQAGSGPNPGILVITPSSNLVSSGLVGGPFTPNAQAYVVRNDGGLPLNWTASKTQSWVTLSKTGGTLAAGAADAVTVTINSGANSLAAGGHSDTVTFTNTTDGTGNTTRNVSLTVNPPAGALSITPSSGLTSSGTQGGPFTPASVTYTLSNTGGQSINWTAAKTQTWVSLNKTSGSLAGGASTTLVVSINSGANSLGAGSHSDTVTFTNTTNGSGNTTRSVALTVNATPGVLAVSPTGGLVSGGMQGGPFSPTNLTYTLSNSGGQSINWTAAKTQSWATLNKTSGSLAAGASTTLVVSINSGANSQTAGTKNDTVTFTNTTNGSGNTTRSVTLHVVPPMTIAASDDTPLAGQSVQLTANTGGASLPTGSSLRWDFGDGTSPAVGNPVNHTYSSAGNYQVCVTLIMTGLGLTNIACDDLTTNGPKTLAVSSSGTNCVTSTASWQNSSFASQNGTFQATFTVTPGAASMDGVVGLSSGAQTSYANFAVLVLFSDTGIIEAYNSGGYDHAATVNYSAGTAYNFRLLVNVAADTYDVFVTPQGGSEQALGSNYGFRTSVSSLNNRGVIAESGSLQVCNFAVGAAPLSANAGQDKTIAPNGSTTLDGSASGGQAPYSYSWSPATGLSNANVAQPTVSRSAVGNYTYTLTVTDAQSNTAVDTVVLQVAVTPLVANAGSDTSIAPGGSTTLSGAGSGGQPPYTYSWSPTTALNNPIIASPALTTTYTLTVRDSVNTTATDSVVVSVITGTIYYVSPSGNDSNLGTEALPWRTLTKAGSTATAGATVFIKAGTYTQTLAPSNAGTSGSWIAFKAAPGDECQTTPTGKNCSVIISGRDPGVDITRNYIRVEGIRIQNGGWGVSVDQSVTGVEVTNCDILGNSNSAIIMWGGSGVRPRQVTIRNNNVYNNQKDGLDGGCIDCVIEGNYIHDQYTSSQHPDCMDLSDSTNLIIRNNTVADCTQLIYLHNYWGGFNNVKIYGNVIYSNKYFTNGGGETQGIFLEGRFSGGAISNVEIHSNTIGWVGYDSIWSYGSVNNVKVRNNIFYDGVNGIDGGGITSSDYNVYFNTNKPSFEGSHSITANPQLVNYVRHSSWDFHLKPSSPAIDMGDPQLGSVMTLPSPFVDMDNVLRPQGARHDAGAYEYQP